MKYRDRKFGSAYDPMGPGGGKIERPQDKPEIRGCGDPDCNMCNPHTAGRGLSSGGGAMPSGSSSFSSDTIRIEMLKSMMRDSVEPTWFASPWNGEPSTDRGPSIPASYTKAREAVEKWIVPAPDQAFDDIVGNSEALDQLRDAIRAPVEHKELYEAYGMKMPKGALLSGPPGCGKTMFAKAAASEMKALYGEATEFLAIAGSELQSPYVGVTEGHIKAIFNYAREYKSYRGHPLLVFMDEADALLPDRTGRVRRVASWEESQVATFLAEMDGVQESGAFVLLASNRPEVIDQAVLRDGRCDFKITVKRPNQDAIAVILRKNFDGVPLHKETSLDDAVFAALESFTDPHKVITEAHAFSLKGVDLGGKNFTLEHIVSGAMAASVPQRAKRYAFARDKASGQIAGVTQRDVIASVGDIFTENAGLDHSFAMREFINEFGREIEMKQAGGLN